MASTKEKETAPVALHTQLMDGMSVKSRTDGSVHTIKAADGKTTVAEVCVGKKNTRLNFKTPPSSKAPKGIELTGHSTSWKGQGVIINEANVGPARELLQFVVESIQPTAEETAAAAAEGSTQEAADNAANRVRGGKTKVEEPATA